MSSFPDLRLRVLQRVQDKRGEAVRCVIRLRKIADICGGEGSLCENHPFPVTADDVVFTVGKVRDPETRARSWVSYFDEVESIEAVDPDVAGEGNDTVEDLVGAPRRVARGEEFFGHPIIDHWADQLDFTTKIFRARGLHLDDRHIRDADGRGFSASIVDMTLYVVNNHLSSRPDQRIGQRMEQVAINAALVTTLLTDYGQPADEAQIWSIWEGNARVQRFGPNGALRDMWGRTSTTLRIAFRGLANLTVQRDGIVVTVETFNKRLRRFTSDGRPRARWTTHAHATGSQPLSVAAFSSVAR